MRHVLYVLSIFILVSCGNDEGDIAGKEGKNFVCESNGSAGDINTRKTDHDRIYKDSSAISTVYLTLYPPDYAKIHLYFQVYRIGPAAEGKYNYKLKKWIPDRRYNEYLFAHTSFKNVIHKMKKYDHGVNSWYKFGRWYFHREYFWLIDETPDIHSGGLAFHGLRFLCKVQTDEDLFNAVIDSTERYQSESDMYRKEIREQDEARNKI